MAAVRGDPAGYALAFDEGKRALAEQRRTLQETRDRAGRLVSVAAAIASLGATLAFGDARLARLTAWGAFAAVAAALGFVVVVSASALIWRPMHGAFFFDPAMLVDDYVEREPHASIGDLHRDLAFHLGHHAHTNAVELSRRLRWLTIALAGFVLEVVALGLVLLDEV